MKGRLLVLYRIFSPQRDIEHLTQNPPLRTVRAFFHQRQVLASVFDYWCDESSAAFELFE